MSTSTSTPSSRENSASTNFKRQLQFAVVAVFFYLMGYKAGYERAKELVGFLLPPFKISVMWSDPRGK